MVLQPTRCGRAAGHGGDPVASSPPRSSAARPNPAETTPIYLFIYDLPRFRDLRKPDDDFGFGATRRGEGRAARRSCSATILRDGPALGVHMVVWCDTLNNLNRTFDRQALREFEMRVLFQMSPADSSNLIDSPAASQLGENRAFFYSEERPAGEVPAVWVARRPSGLASLRITPPGE